MWDTRASTPWLARGLCSKPSTGLPEIPKLWNSVNWLRVSESPFHELKLVYFLVLPRFGDFKLDFVVNLTCLSFFEACLTDIWKFRYQNIDEKVRISANLFYLWTIDSMLNKSQPTRALQWARSSGCMCWNSNFKSSLGPTVELHVFTENLNFTIRYVLLIKNIIMMLWMSQQSNKKIFWNFCYFNIFIRTKKICKTKSKTHTSN